MEALKKNLKSLDLYIRCTPNKSREGREWIRQTETLLMKEIGAEGVPVNESGIAKYTYRSRVILLNGREKREEKGEYLFLPYQNLESNQLVILVRHRKVISFQGMSRDYLRIKVDDSSNEQSIKEVIKRLLVIFGAPCIRAADRDKVYWAEVPRMVLVNKERRRPLGIYIISRKVHPTNDCSTIILIKEVSGASAGDKKLRAYMHLQSVNGVLLDELISEDASEFIKNLDEGPVFCMVRDPHRDSSKPISPISPISPNDLDPLVNSPVIRKMIGICRVNDNPFKLTWLENLKEVPVDPYHPRYFTQALIVDPVESTQRATIINFAEEVSQFPGSRGSLVVQVNGEEALGKNPEEVKQMIKHSGSTALVGMYLCSDSPCGIAEATYTENFETFRSNFHEVPPTKEDDGGVFCEPDDNSELVSSRHQYIPIYLTGTNRLTNLKVYEALTQEAVSADTDSWGEETGQMRSSTTSSRKQDTPNGEEHSLPPPIPPSTLNILKQPSPLVHSRTSLGSITPDQVQTPIKQLLLQRQVSKRWSRLIQEGEYYKYVLQTVNTHLLDKGGEPLTLTNQMELMYLRNNTICTYMIDLEQYQASTYDTYGALMDFLSIFQSYLKPQGMQVILVGTYDSKSDHRVRVQKDALKWFQENLPTPLQKRFNEVLYENVNEGKMHLVLVDLANLEGSTQSLRDTVDHCTNIYHQRTEEKKPQSTAGSPSQWSKWPLLVQKVNEKALSSPLVTREELVNLTTQILWVEEEGDLFEACIRELEKCTLLHSCSHIDDYPHGLNYLINPDIIVKVVSSLTNKDELRSLIPEIKKLFKKEEASIVENGNCISHKCLEMVIKKLSYNLTDVQCDHLIKWMVILKVMHPVRVEGKEYYFIPALASKKKRKDPTSFMFKLSPQSSKGPSSNVIRMFIQFSKQHASSIFFHKFISLLLLSPENIENIQKEEFIVNQNCTKVKIPRLQIGATAFQTTEAVISYSRLQALIKIELRPWQVGIVQVAQQFFSKLLEKTMENSSEELLGHYEMGPSFDKMVDNARYVDVFKVLSESQPYDCESSDEDLKPIFVCDALMLKKSIESNPASQVFFQDQVTNDWKCFNVSQISGLNQWLYDPKMLFGDDKRSDVEFMHAWNNIAEWLLQDPQTCTLIACEYNLIDPKGPEATNWPSNIGREPTSYKLMRRWRERGLPLTDLHKVLQQHNHHAAARELTPFLNDSFKYASSEV